TSSEPPVASPVGGAGGRGGGSGGVFAGRRLWAAFAGAPALRLRSARRPPPFVSSGPPGENHEVSWPAPGRDALSAAAAAFPVFGAGCLRAFALFTGTGTADVLTGGGDVAGTARTEARSLARTTRRPLAVRWKTRAKAISAAISRRR